MTQYILAYEYMSENYGIMRKAVICSSYSEYKRVREKIERTKGHRLLEFDHVFESEQIPD